MHCVILAVCQHRFGAHASIASFNRSTLYLLIGQWPFSIIMNLRGIRFEKGRTIYNQKTDRFIFILLFFSIRIPARSFFSTFSPFFYWSLSLSYLSSSHPWSLLFYLSSSLLLMLPPLSISGFFFFRALLLQHSLIRVELCLNEALVDSVEAKHFCSIDAQYEY